MSSVTTRKKVNRIESAPLLSGTEFAGLCIQGLAVGLGVAAVAAFSAARKSRPSGKTKQTVSSVAEIRSKYGHLDTKQLDIQSIDVAKGQALAQVAERPLVVADTQKLKTDVENLNRAKTLAEVKVAQSKMVSTLEADTQNAFTRSVVGACQRASTRIGFARIEPLPSPRTSVIRFSATDSVGRTIVTEVSAAKESDVQIETEVVGVTDGTCQEILDHFDQALEAEGVRSLPPERRSTGGICQISAAREFIRRQVKPVKRNKKTKDKRSVADKDAKRRQRLNRPQPRLKQK